MTVTASDLANTAGAVENILGDQLRDTNAQ